MTNRRIYYTLGTILCLIAASFLVSACFFFVDGEYHRRGIGRRLFEFVMRSVSIRPITLNSSPYGLPFYRAIGFKEASGEQTVNGIRFTPMVFGEAV